jgi:hypothetical protein
MPLGPDIIVTEPDTPEELLAVEVQTGAGAAQAAEADLKEYMVRQNCPIGMLVTDEHVLFFRNLYEGRDPDTIRKIGECRTDELFEAMSPETPFPERYLVLVVQQWLENLRFRSRRSWPPTASEAIEWFVLPEVIAGTIGSTGKRWRPPGY